MKRFLAAAALAAGLALTMCSPALATYSSNPSDCSGDSSMALADCTSTPPSTQPAPTASSSPSPSPTPTATVAPHTAAEEWAKGAAESQAGIAKQLQDSYSHPVSATWSPTLLTAYSFTFAIGLAILAVVMLVSGARAARANPQARAEAVTQFIRINAYYPAMMLVPLLVKFTGDALHGLAEGLVAESGKSFVDFLGTFAEVMGKDPLGSIIGALGGGVAALLLLIPVLLFMMMWWIEDIASVFGVQLLMLLVPITAAISFFPKMQRFASRAVGFLLGCLLTPVVTRFAFWVTWAIVGDQLKASPNALYSMLIVVVVAFMATSAPVMLAYIMPMLLPDSRGVYSGGGGVGRGAQQLVDSVGDGFSKLSKGGGGDKAAAEAAGSEATAQAAKAAGTQAAGEAVAAGAAEGSVAGPAGAIAGAVIGAVGAVGSMAASAARGAASEQLQAGGGATSAADTAGLRIPQGLGAAAGGGSTGGGSTGGGSTEGGGGTVDSSVAEPMAADWAAWSGDGGGVGDVIVPQEFGGVEETAVMPTLDGVDAPVIPLESPAVEPLDMSPVPGPPPMVPGTPDMGPARQVAASERPRPSSPPAAGPPPMPKPIPRGGQ